MNILVVLILVMSCENAHDVMAAMLLYQTNPVRVQLFSNVNTLFCDKFAWLLETCVYALYTLIIGY